MGRKYLFILACGFAILNCAAQIPVMNPITGPANVCSSPAAPMSFSTSAINSPTAYQWYVSTPSVGVIIGSPTSATTTISFPYSNATYTLYCQASNGFGTSPTTSFVVNIFETPSVTFSGANSFCQGSSTNLQASSTILMASPTISYSWAAAYGLNVTNQPNVIANPSVTTTYTVVATKGICSNSAQITVSVLPTPTISINITNTTLCLGNSLTLTANGANSYTWTGGITNGIGFSPITSANYTVTAQDFNVCTASSVSTVIVNPPPAVMANATNSVICLGSTTSLYGSGAVNYTWAAGVINGAVFSPTVTNTYSVTGSSPACPGTSSAVITVTVNPNPTLSVVSNTNSICVGETATLTITGNANSYSVNGVSSFTIAQISPTVTSTFTISGMNAFGCISTFTISQFVAPCGVGIKVNTLTENNGLLVYPNPSNGAFFIRSGKSEIAVITNELGQIIRTINLIADAEAKISGLSGGIYFIITPVTKLKMVVIQ